MIKIRIDKAKEDDITVVAELLKKLYIELGEESLSANFLDTRLINEIINSGNTEIYLAKTEDNKTVGIATLTECQSIYAGGKYGLLDEMYVIPELRSNKIGKELLNRIKIIAKERGWKRIDVTAPTEERWKRTVSFYENFGFVFTGPKLKLEI